MGVSVGLGRGIGKIGKTALSVLLKYKYDKLARRLQSLMLQGFARFRAELILFYMF